MPKSLLLFGCGLAIFITTSGMVSQAQIFAPGTSVTPSGIPSGVPGSSERIPTPGKKPLASTIATFNCQSRAGQTKVVLKSDRTYKTGANPYPPISGAYQKIGDAYRFKDGSFKKRSIVKLRTSYYLVDTDKEARAASLAAVDAAFTCTKK